MKGVAAWIWIIMSVVLGILVVVFGSTLIFNQLDLTQKQLAIDEFTDFAGKIKTVCTEGVGEIYYYKISIPEKTRAIYVSNFSDQLPPDKVSDFITKGKSSLGTYVCMQFFDENLPRCVQISCYTNFNYIGTPSLQPLLQSLVARLSGQYPTYYFLVRIEKTDYNYVLVNATQTIGSQNPSITTPSTTTTMTSITTTTTMQIV
jgi:hypothetical protein